MSNTGSALSSTTTTMTTTTSTSRTTASSVNVGAQVSSRVKKMDPTPLQEAPTIIQRKVELEDGTSVMMLDVQTNRSKILANAFRYILRHFPQIGIVHLYLMGRIVRSTGEVQINVNVWTRLKKTEFFAIVMDPEISTIMIPFEVKTKEYKIECSSGLLDYNNFLEKRFWKTGTALQSIRDHQTNFLLMLGKNFMQTIEIRKMYFGNSKDFSNYLEACIVALKVIVFRCNYLMGRCFNIAPTLLNSYLLYEIFLTEYFMVINLLDKHFAQRNDIYFPEIIEFSLQQIIYLSQILKVLKPYAVEAYIALGYEERDFISSDIEIKEALSNFNFNLTKYNFKTDASINLQSIGQESISLASSCPHFGDSKYKKSKKKKVKSNKKKIKNGKATQRKKPQTKKLEERKLEECKPEQLASYSPSISTTSEPSLELIEFQKQRALQRQEWEKTKEKQNTQRIERKRTFAKETVSEYQEAVELVEQKRLADRVAETKILYHLPTRDQFEKMYTALSNGQRRTFDCLFTAESFSITSDDIENLAEKFKELMTDLGLDSLTIEKFKSEVLKRNHPAHSSDTGNKLLEGYIEKRATSFIIFGLFPIGWEYTSFDEYSAFKIYEQRNIVRQLAQL